jgi:cobalt-zinc-cadmium efflux system membrane fusion protein
VHVGDAALISTGADTKPIQGTVTNIGSLLDPDTRSVSVRVAADNAAGLLKKQMYVRVNIQSQQQSSGLLVPASAVLHDDENLPFVYVQQRDGSFARAHVSLGYRSGNTYQIDSGLGAGERIVVDGALFIQFMQSQ